MHFDHSETVRHWLDRLQVFMDEQVLPREQEYHRQLQAEPWAEPPILEDLKSRARAAGLWNLFMPDPEFGPGLSNLEYAPLAEAMGRVLFAPRVFNCSAPDTGNMEVLAQFGSAAQKERWLQPLLDGEIRSAFAMTEPAVASSDATNIETSIVRDGSEYVINGHKTYISGAAGRACKILIVMGKTDPANPDRHRQQSMVLVPTDTAGVEIVRAMTVFGYDDAPEGHAEVIFRSVRVPVDHVILGEGRGFEIAQARLGPGRIHHCMRLIGQAQRALELMCRRANQRVAFGRPLAEQGSVREAIAQSACEIEQARLLTLKAADRMDRVGNKEARDLIAMIKVVAPRMACTVIDRAIQLHGAAGLGQDQPLAHAYAYARSIRLADGPDEVHMMQLGRNLAQQAAAEAR